MYNRKKTFFTAAALFCLNASLFAQSVNLQLDQVSVKQAMNELKKESGYSFVYVSGDVDTQKQVTVKATQLDELIKQILQGQEVTYEIKGKNIIVKKIVSSAPQQDKKTRKISGVVKDAQGEPVIGANVVVKGDELNGVITDFDGNFTLDVPEDGSFEVSYIGYLSQVLPVKGKSTFMVSLKEDTKTLDEVVVIGYTTQKKGLLSGSVEHMKMDDQMKTMPTTAAGNLLVGKLAGVDVSTPGAIPGSDPDITIRTVSAWKRDNKKQQPVTYVIDGVVRGAGDFNNLSPNEIDDITVLKDAASAAIYGSRSAGGVILVTTKKGKTGKPTVNYSYSYSVDTRTKNSDLTSAIETGELYNRINGEADPAGWAWSQEELDYFKNVNGGWGYDQLDMVYRNPATQTHNVSVNGGNEKIRYFAGGSYVQQKGFLEPLSYDKYNLRLNVTADVSDNFQVQTGLALYNNKKGNVADNENPWDTYKKLRVWQPDQAVFTDSGQYIDYGWIGNVGARVKGGSGYNKNEYLKPQLTVSGTYKAPFLKGLSAKMSYSKSWTNEITKKFYTNYDMMIMKRSGPNNRIMSTKDSDIVGVKRSSWITKDYIERKSAWSDDQQLNFQLSYDNVFNDVHRVSGTLVTEWYEGGGASIWGGREGFPVYTTDQFWAASGTRADSWAGGDTDWKDGRMSYIGQFNYSYADKYLFTFSFREDGSMKFAPDKRWGFFPAASAGWVVSEENWFDKKHVQRLKLRASAGLTGDDSVGGWQWQESYISDGKNAYFGKNPSRRVGLTYGSVVNENMTWEKSLSFDLGVDMDFLDHWNLSLDYWYRNTYDILDNRVLSLPSTFSLSMPAENYGKVRAQGIDFKLGYSGQSKDFTYFANLTASYGWNEVITKDYAENAKWYDIPVGRSLSYITGYKFDRIIGTQEELDAFIEAHPGYLHKGKSPELGMMVFKDLSGPDGTPDGIIDSWDKTILKNKNNPLIYGLNLGGSWKGLSLDMMFSGRLGSYKWMKDLVQGVEWNRMWKEWYTDSWSPENPHASLPMRKNHDQTKTYDEDTDYWLKKNNFMRMKYLTVSYELPKNQFYSSVFDKVRVFFTGTNLFVWSNFNKNYYDPEIGDGNSFPVSRSFSFGIDVSF